MREVLSFPHPNLILPFSNLFESYIFFFFRKATSGFFLTCPFRFARENGAGLAKIDPFAHAQRLTAVMLLTDLRQFERSLFSYQLFTRFGLRTCYFLVRACE